MSLIATGSCDSSAPARPLGAEDRCGAESCSVRQCDEFFNYLQDWLRGLWFNSVRVYLRSCNEL